MAVKEYFILHKSQAETASGPLASTSPGYPQIHFLGNYDKGRFYLSVSAISGTTPSLTVWIEEKDELSGLWVVSLNTAGSAAIFAAQTAVTPAGSNGSSGTVGNNALTVDVSPLMAQKYRCNWTLTGTTPSATFTVGTWCGSSEGAAS